MTTIVTRAGKGSALTHNEVDSNFTNLNSAKYESGDNASLGSLSYSTTLTGGTGVVNLGSGQFYKDASGNVGIGTNNPTVRLQVNSAGSNLARFYGNNANNYIEVSDNNGTNNCSYGSIAGGNSYTYTAGYHATYAGATERMRIDSSGNVGIGTSSPYSKLDVFGTTTPESPTTGEATGVGTIRISNGSTALSSEGGLEFKIAGDSNGFGSKIQALNSSGSQLVFANRFASATWTERMRIDSSGNVGIGTSSPTSGYKLDVAGNFKLSGSIDENVYAVVDAAGVALSPQNGTIQTWTLGASRTPTLGTWEAGESMTLMINDGTAYTVTWTTMGIVWVGGSAPTLATSGFTVIELWRVGSTYYGALVGEVA